jgi:hypothetical protein
MNKNDDDDAIECVSIRGVIVDLRDVSPDLRRQYHLATKAIGRLDKARDQLKGLGDAILSEQAIKYAPRASGTGNVIEALRKRS